MTTGAVVGRDRERAELNSALLRADGPGAIVIEGPPGIGKTTLWRDAVDAARASGCTVLACRAALPEVPFAFGALVDLFDRVPSDALAHLAEPQQVALLAALLRTAPTGTPDALAVSAAVRAAVLDLARDAPVVVAVDDAQWLDPATRDVLSYVARRLTTERVVFLLAVRSGTEHDHGSLPIPPAGWVHRSEVRPLSLSGLHHVIRDRTGMVIPRPMLHRIAHASAGNPLFALEIAGAIASAPVPPGPADPLPVPATLGELVARRLRTLPGATREVLLVASMLADPSIERLEDVLGGDVESRLEPARMAEIVDLVDDRVVFRHPLFGQGMLGLASVRDRRAAHVRIATATADMEVAARHLAFAAAAPDARIAATLADGAAAAWKRGALRTAAELFEHAATLTPPHDTGDAHARAFGAAEAYILVGGRVRARELLGPVAAHGTPTQRARALGLIAEVHANSGELAEARSLLEGLVRQVADPVTRTRLELDLLYVSLLELDIDAAAGHATRAAASAVTADDRALGAEARAYGSLVAMLQGGTNAHELLTAALGDENPDRAPYMALPPRGIAAIVHLLEDQFDAARTDLDVVRARLEALGDESDLAHVHLWQAWLGLRTGRLASAAADASAMATIAEMTGSPLLHRWGHALGALVEAHRGDEAGTAMHLREAGSASELPPLLRSWRDGAAGLAALRRGDVATAFAELEGLIAWLERGMPGDPSLASVVPDAVEAMVGVGVVERAAALADAYETRARTTRRRSAIAAAARAQGSVLAARGAFDEARSRLGEGAAIADEIGMPLEGARCRLLIGTVERRQGGRRAAVRALERAAELFDAAGADGWAARARREAARVPIRRLAGAHLTSSELRVAELSGAGRTNRDVAVALFVSPKTVEANLARIYRKLGISTRAELGAWLAGERNGNQPPKP